MSGVPIRLAWAGSANQLKSDPAGLAIVDERDGATPQSRHRTARKVQPFGACAEHDRLYDGLEPQRWRNSGRSGNAAGLGDQDGDVVSEVDQRRIFASVLNADSRPQLRSRQQRSVRVRRRNIEHERLRPLLPSAHVVDLQGADGSRRTFLANPRYRLQRERGT